MKLDYSRAYLLLGSNLGERRSYLDEALVLIGRLIGEITSKSAVYETEAWGKTDQPGFLNLAVQVRTTLEPVQVLRQALTIEQMLGRVREEKWGARLIDIDVIFYDDEIISIKGELEIPHPEMHKRKFVLVPLAEIAPEFVHPGLNQRIDDLLGKVDDPLVVKRC